MRLVERVKTKSPSMKARGVAFAIEALANISIPNTEEQIGQVFARLESVVLTKLDEFIPHYLVKTLVAYSKVGHGSGELYDRLITQFIQAMTKDDGHTVKYSDLIKFFEVFPNVTYIYDHTMNSELYQVFIK